MALFCEILVLALLLHSVQGYGGLISETGNGFKYSPNIGTRRTHARVIRPANIFSPKVQKTRYQSRLDNNNLANGLCRARLKLLPENIKYECPYKNYCLLRCPKDFFFLGGLKHLHLSCQTGKLIGNGSPFGTKIPQCTPGCVPPCYNNGVCLKPGLCKCPENYYGSICQCDRPRVPLNTNIFCGSDICKLECQSKYQFPDGRKTISLQCLNSKWIDTEIGGALVPDCQPTCDPPCANGGTCISVDKCICAGDFKGPQCQYDINDVCRTKKSDDSDFPLHPMAYCLPGEEEQTCYLICPDKATLTGPISEEYKCKYSVGEFQPPLPTCYYKIEAPPNFQLYEKPKGIPSTKAACITWSGTNLKTLDGSILRTQLTGSHTLISDKTNAAFSVTLKVCPFKPQNNECHSSLIVLWQSNAYTFENIDGTVKLSTGKNQLPISVQTRGMKVQSAAQQLRINLYLAGLVIEWNKDQYVAIAAKPILLNSVVGLCGSFDGDAANDFISKDGVVLKTPEEFVNSWRLPDGAVIEKVDLFKKCDETQQAKAYESCQQMLRNSKLALCLKPFDTQTLIKMCINDYCNCGNLDQPESCICDSVAMLVKECELRGITMENGWRDLQICPIQCKNNRVYRPCGPNIEPSCGSQVVPEKAKCIEGCFCPDGTVEHKDSCISPKLCPCTLRRKVFEAGSTIQKDCNTCTCESGVWTCSEKNCGARCSAYGDPHYTTFDGKRYDFMGRFSYYLLQSDNLSIEAENVDCYGSYPTCTKSITVNIELNRVDTTIRLDRQLLTSVNGNKIDKFPHSLDNGKVIIRQDGTTGVLIDFADGVRVSWNGLENWYIDVPWSYRGKTAGLCGTFTSQVEDDFLSEDGNVVADTVEFGNSWKIKDTMKDLSQEDVALHSNPCKSSPAKQSFAEAHCLLLTGDIFKDCHWSVAPEPYYESCMFDVCTCSGDLTQCFCIILAAYGNQCLKQGIRTTWRSTVKECAVNCPTGQVFDNCLDICARSCDDVATKKSCKGQCTEGCRCPDGQFFNDKNVCVPTAECPCSHKGTTFDVGYKQVQSRENTLRVCTCKGASWDCQTATPEDTSKYPLSAEAQAHCEKIPNAEFSKCVPSKRRTCKNMHNYIENLKDCSPGCICKTGYVYNMLVEACVKPDDCFCSKYGATYPNGYKWTMDCNECTCQTGHWACTSNVCEATCSTWGSSHYTTFDKRDFDFAGECDYVLSRGNSKGDSFHIQIQNVMCISFEGVCSKSLEIGLSGSIDQTIMFSTDSSSLNKIREQLGNNGQSFIVYKSGLFNVLEVVPFKIQIKWDQGSRVYVRLGTNWIGKVNGLCGNYNAIADDDMKASAQGFEMSPLEFGHSWRMQSSCEAPTAKTNACEGQPERREWAQIKCGIIHSKLFKECHSEIAADTYMQRCIEDACSCSDQDGGCEFLCTAVAAYADSCSLKGIEIQWRTPDLCPMHCDSKDAEYDACTPACAIDTCDNVLSQAITDRMCLKENCIEGCRMKQPCEEGMIFLKDSLLQCVHKSECKPIGMVKNGKEFREGDVTLTDKCQTCWCSNQKELCSGEPCAEATALPKEKNCVPGWTSWFMAYNAEAVDDYYSYGELQYIKLDLFKAIYDTCDQQFIAKNECRKQNSKNDSYSCTIEEVQECDSCHDSEIRSFCDCGEDVNVEPTDGAIQCPIGEQWSECANHCEHACHYYEKDLIKRGRCKVGDLCKGGCVDESLPNCQAINKVWRDRVTCVEIDECPCMTHDGQYVKPVSLFSHNDSRTCQCIDNTVLCSDDDHPEEVTTQIPGTTITDSTDELAISSNKPFTVPTTTTPPLKCAVKQLIVMINGATPLPDTAFDASSTLNDSYRPHFGRLHSKGSWSPHISDQDQYFEVAFDEPQPLFGVIMQGSPVSDQYVTLFKILYSIDGVGLHDLVDETDKPQLFSGPIDPRTPVESLFKLPIEAKLVRIYPVEWRGSIAMRVELLGCSQELVQPGRPEVLTSGSWEDTPKCTDPMGVESGLIHFSQVTASSIRPRRLGAEQPRLLDVLKLSSDASWKPAVNSLKEYVEFDFLEARELTGVTTKGGSDGWTTAFQVVYSNDGFAWNSILAPDGKPKVFIANHDRGTPQVNYFKLSIQARILRIMPTKWVSNINLRIEVLGCFIAYPKIKQEVVEAKPQKCAVCDSISNDGDDCKCKDPLFWDGQECIEKHLCPCVDNELRHKVGSKFESKTCQECVCVVGGLMRCSPMKCAPCKPGLRITRTATCACRCEPCPDKHKLCPSSGDCIPDEHWCNGVKDCEDDEPAECPKLIEETNTAAAVETCPPPACPNGMILNIADKSATRQMSEIFAPTILTTIHHTSDDNDDQNCAVFTCTPKTPTRAVQNHRCPIPKCPDAYEVRTDNSKTRPGECSKYTCVLSPHKDYICEITSKSLVTFDGTDLKYTARRHILARNMGNSWSISAHVVRVANSDICHKVLTIKDKTSDDKLVIMPNLQLQINGFDYTPRQLEKSHLIKPLFVVSQLGDSVLVVSNLHGFWVSYHETGGIHIGVSEKFIKTVDGLCGYFTGYPADDKRIPDGSTASTTNQFGDSWLDKDMPNEECPSQVCTSDDQAQALALCKSIEHPSFAKCGKSVNLKQFLSKCIEDTCECLKVNKADPQSCKCLALQGFVKKCLAASPHIQLGTWRSVHQCEISCAAPLVHMDCYKRRCEPSCDNRNGDDCPLLPDACFGGCFCPEGTLRKGDTCISINECKDCVCEAFGASQYLTFDRRNFSFNGNCMYMLSKDVGLTDGHTFEVYVRMDDCQKLGHPSMGPNRSCTKSLHILHGEHIIQIQRVVPNKSVQVLIDGSEVKKLPFRDTRLHITKTNSNGLKLALPESHVEVTSSFDDMAFSIRVPSSRYARHMEGLCGDCDGDGDNDLKINPAKQSPQLPLPVSIVGIVSSWETDDPRLQEPFECSTQEVPADGCNHSAKEEDLCLRFSDENLFGKCRAVVSPLSYVSQCEQDTCGGNKNAACNSLAAYARECVKNGICLNWRSSDLCPYGCPADLVYIPCGCVMTCASLKFDDILQAIDMRTGAKVNRNGEKECNSDLAEGCFCPHGSVSYNDGCILEEECSRCDDGNHFVGDVWVKDKCTKCSCNKDGKTECVEQQCQAAEIICPDGFKPSKTASAAGDCCPKYTCVSEPNVPTPAACQPPVLPKCGDDQLMKQRIGANGCTQITCECKPSSLCESARVAIPLKPGQSILLDNSGCCPVQNIVCDTASCPTLRTQCEQEFYKLKVVTQPGECCPTAVCSPPTDACVVTINGIPTVKLLGDKWFAPETPCDQHVCSYGSRGVAEVNKLTEHCHKDCIKGFEYKSQDPSKCCGSCVQTKCVFEDHLYAPGDSWRSTDLCITYSCDNLLGYSVISSSKVACSDVSNCPPEQLEDAGCCKVCKSHAHEKCQLTSPSVKDTNKLMQFNVPHHGLCTNKGTIQELMECSGSCQSGSIYNAERESFDTACSYCGIIEYKHIVVNFVCNDGFQFHKKIEIPASCGCTKCANAANPDGYSQIDI